MFKKIRRRDFVKALSVAGTAGLAGVSCWRDAACDAAETTGAKCPWPFYAFDNGLKDIPSLADKCKLLKDLGYDGLEYHIEAGQLPQLLELLDKHGLKLFGVYTMPWLEEPLPGEWREWISVLKGRETRIELAIRSRRLKPSDTAGDAHAETLLKRVSDLCGDSGPVASVYPHADMWTERVDDGIRLAKRVARKNVGTNFNLVHWQWVKQARPLGDVLKEALPHLLLVTLNGLTGPAAERQKIRPLNESDCDLRAFLTLVGKVGYRGPMGLQCYSVAEPAATHLKRSMEAWRRLTAGIE